MSTPARPLDPREADPLFFLGVEAGQEAMAALADYRRHRFLQGFLAGVVIGLAAGVCGAVVFR